MIVTEPVTIQPGDLLRIEEAAHLATVQPSTIRAWLTQGRLPRVKVGRCTRILRRDLEELIRAGRRAPNSFALKENGNTPSLAVDGVSAVGESLNESQRKENRNANQNSQFLAQQ
jgi:excisionase family DNA binding protein